MVSKKQFKLYEIHEMKKNNIPFACYCNSKQAVTILNELITTKVLNKNDFIITYNIPRPKFSKNFQRLSKKLNLDKIKIIYCFSMGNNNAYSIDYLYNIISKIKPEIVIQDQTSFPNENKVRNHYFRNIIYSLNKNSVIPSHYANDEYINNLVKMTNSFKKDITLLDMCSGQGSIGLSVLNECSNIKKLILVEYNKNQIKQIKKTIKQNKLPNDKIILIQSDGLDSVPDDLKVDLVSCNPPHFNIKIKNLNDRTGKDENWNFHRKFLQKIPDYITEGGIVTLLEHKDGFKKRICKSLINNRLVLKDFKNFNFTTWNMIIFKN